MGQCKGNTRRLIWLQPPTPAIIADLYLLFTERRNTIRERVRSYLELARVI
jgi:hypothetical protein